MKGRRDEDLKELRKKLGQMQAASNRHERRALAAKFRKSAGLRFNQFMPGGIEFVTSGARTGSNRSRPLRWRTRKGAN